jgi:hypothetical protein
VSDAGGAEGWIDTLLAPEGRALLEELRGEPLTAASALALQTRLRARYAPGLIAAALTQARLRERARSKFTHAGEMFFTAAGLEQASSERMARHHARRYVTAARVADLCSGIGGDLIGLAEVAQVVAVDRDPVHSRIGQINAEVNGVAERAHAVCADVRDVPLGEPNDTAVFIDPARRTDDRRLQPGASEPPLGWCFGLADGGRAVGIKAAPGLPFDLVPDGWEIELVSEHRELKESALWSPHLATQRRRATILPSGETLAADVEPALAARAPGLFLLDPDPAVTRAGLVCVLGESLAPAGEVWNVDAQVAFLSADHEAQTPFARTMTIEASMPWSLARVRDALRALDVGSVDIRKRGSAVDVEALHRRLKLSGGRAATVVLTRVADKPWAMICTVLPGGGTVP